MHKALVDDSEWRSFADSIFREAALLRLSQDYYEQGVAGRQRAGRMQHAGRLVCAHSPETVLEKLSPLLTEAAKQEAVLMLEYWRRLTSRPFMPNDNFQDHRWVSLSAQEQLRIKQEGRQLVFRQLHEMVQGSILYHLDGGVAKSVERAAEASRIALLYRLLDDHRRQSMVERSLQPQTLALPTFSEDEADADIAMEPDQGQDYYQHPRSSRE